MNCEELYISHAINPWLKCSQLFLFQPDALSIDDAKRWLTQVLSKPSTVSTIFDKYFDYPKLIYIFNKYGDDPDIAAQCKLIIDTICRFYEQKIQYLSRIELKELPLSE